MRRPHLLRVEKAPEAFAPVIRALSALGLRAGWLDLGASDPVPLPPALAAAAGTGVLRAVAVGSGGSVAVKPRGGPPVLDDLLREHFLGCRLVLVRAEAGAVEAPRLTPLGEGRYRVEAGGRAAEELTAPKLAERLRKPRPWGREDG